MHNIKNMVPEFFPKTGDCQQLGIYLFLFCIFDNGQYIGYGVSKLFFAVAISLCSKHSTVLYQRNDGCLISIASRHCNNLTDFT